MQSVVTKEERENEARSDTFQRQGWRCDGSQESLVWWRRHVDRSGLGWRLRGRERDKEKKRAPDAKGQRQRDKTGRSRGRQKHQKDRERPETGDANLDSAKCNYYCSFPLSVRYRDQ